jgi:hypothetical protein
VQILLFPDPKPLVERLGAEFFRNIPQEPGVYFMEGPPDTVLYVGKARNLRKRLSSYRVANADRMARRTLRLLRLVERIRWEPCATESAAISREAELLRSLKPRFNRAGVWAPKPRLLHFRVAPAGLELLLSEMPEKGWDVSMSLGGGGEFFRQSLVRSIWRLANPCLATSAMPEGWFHGRIPNPVLIPQPLALNLNLTLSLKSLLTGTPYPFLELVKTSAQKCTIPFEIAAINADLETLEGFLPDGNSANERTVTASTSLDLPLPSAHRI